MYNITKTEFEILINKGLKVSQIAEVLNISISTVTRKLKSYNLWNAYKDITMFDIIDTEEKAYWLGFIYADGCINKHDYNNYRLQINLNSKDESHLKKFAAFISNKVKVVTKNNISRCYVQNQHLCNTLINLGCIPRKSCTLTFPLLSIFSNHNLVYDFIRGYVDGDGCITYSNKTISKISIIGTKEFLRCIMDLFPHCFSMTKDKRWKNNTYYIYTTNKQSFLKVGNKIYRNATIALDRKLNRYKIGVLQSNL